MSPQIFERKNYHAHNFESDLLMHHKWYMRTADALPRKNDIISGNANKHFQKMRAVKSYTEIKWIGVEDALPTILWAQYFLEQ